MKRRLQIAICSLCFMMVGGCEILQFPLKLFSELLPLAIKYAPYALMFLEAPPENPEQLAANSERDLAVTAEISKLPLPQVLDKLLGENPQNICIVAIQLKSQNSDIEIEQWLKNHPGYKIRYVNTYCDFSDNTQYRQVQALLQVYEDVPFVATGPLEGLSNANERQMALLQGLESSE